MSSRLEVHLGHGGNGCPYDVDTSADIQQSVQIALMTVARLSNPDCAESEVSDSEVSWTQLTALWRQTTRTPAGHMIFCIRRRIVT